jgi:aryl-alcohol dehydrogenase-like predicted oxidoreductase
MVVATKVGSEMPGLGQAFGLSRPLIRAGAEGSLARLDVDRIDLYYAHWPDPGTDLAETLGAFDELVREGLVHAPAASNFGPGLVRRALEISRDEGLARVEALQPPYSLMRRSPYEGELEDLCLVEEIGVAPYYSLARGFLTGKYRPGRPLPASARAPEVAADHMNERGFAVLDALDRVAGEHGATTAQVALAWLMARPSITAPIASATTAEQARELCGAADLELSEEQIRLVDEASRPVSV